MSAPSPGPTPALNPSAARPAGLASGALVSDRYRVIRLLGCGGMGCVHLAQDAVLGREVALKQLTSLRSGDASVWRRALHEARAMAGVQHAGIAAVHDLLPGTPPTLVMEFVDGRPLDAWLEEAPAAPDVIFVLLAVVAAVAEAHRAGIVHCDLKPANIMVTRDGRPKVLDFGIARLAIPSDAAGAATGASGFTPGYAPPEVLRGERPTRASDVYSLGILIEHVLDACAWTGCPLGADQPFRRIAAEAQSLRAADRPADGEALLRRLRAARSPVAARVASRHRHRVASVAGALIVAAGCVGGGLTLVRDRGATTPNAPRLAVAARVDPAASSTMSAAAADLLLARLQEWRNVRVVSEPVPGATGDHHALLEQARGRGATHVVVPTLSTVGASTRLTAAVFDVQSGRLDRTVTKYGAPGGVPALITATADSLAQAMSASTTGPEAVSPQPSIDERALGDYSQALRYLERPDTPGALGQARRLLESAVMQAPAFARAHAQLGRLGWLEYHATRDHRHLAAAEQALLDALALDPDATATHTALALVRRTRGDLDGAERELQSVLAQAPDDDYALRLLGEVAATRGDLDAARELIGRAIALQPGTWGHHRALGTVLFDAGRYGESGLAFARLTNLQPDNAWGFQMLGAAHQMNGAPAAAIKAYESSLELRPTASATTNLATLYYERGDWPAAERRYRQAVALQPNNPSMHRNLGDVLLRQSRQGEARVAFADALRLLEAQLSVEHGDARLLGTAAYLSARAGMCDQARDYATRGERAAAGNPIVLGAAVNAHVLCGGVDDAARVLGTLGAKHAPVPRLLERDVLEAARANSRLAPLVVDGGAVRARQEA
ncbi:MAG TPA: protein kinase [Luteitalea sp.]|nr:protein kinase [Luteitalea sp.]